jgi:hypothetical protein
LGFTRIQPILALFYANQSGYVSGTFQNTDKRPIIINFVNCSGTLLNVPKQPIQPGENFKVNGSCPKLLKFWGLNVGDRFKLDIQIGYTVTSDGQELNYTDQGRICSYIEEPRKGY